jgi:hypothetical protein
MWCNCHKVSNFCSMLKNNSCTVTAITHKLSGSSLCFFFKYHKFTKCSLSSSHFVSEASIIKVKSVKKCVNVCMTKQWLLTRFWAVQSTVFYVDFYMGVVGWVQKNLCLVNFISTFPRLLSSTENVILQYDCL